MSFKMSNSKMHDWETMCPIEFKAKHIDKIIRFSPTIEMEWGNYFETLVIGGGINGVFKFEESDHGDKMLRSEHKERVEKQAAACKRYLAMYGGKAMGRQEYICVTIEDNEGNNIELEGTLDIRYVMTSDGRTIVIDLKFTGDTENDFGKFAWGNPEKMDLSQIIQYGLLTQIKYKLEEFPETQYWIFDKGKEMKQKLLKVRVSDGAVYDHINRISEAYHSIVLSILMDDWPPKNTWENCSKCKFHTEENPCKFRRVMPEFVEIEI